MKKYKKGAYSIISTDKDANIVGRFLDKNFPSGQYKPHDVVEIARPKNSPIHRYFEWDNTRAAKLYRIYQARNLVRSLVVIVHDKPVRAFGSVVVKDVGRSYVSEAIIENDEDLSFQIIDEAFNEAEVWMRKYEHYSQLKGIVAAIKQENKRWQKRKERKLKKQR